MISSLHRRPVHGLDLTQCAFAQVVLLVQSRILFVIHPEVYLCAPPPFGKRLLPSRTWWERAQTVPS